jgi:hypothetical protein
MQKSHALFAGHTSSRVATMKNAHFATAAILGRKLI